MLFCCSFILNSVEANQSEPIILKNDTKKENMYPVIDILKEQTNDLTIEDVVSEDYSSRFILSHEIKQKKGFFERINWLRFEVTNESNRNDWLLEFAFPLINDIQLYTKTEGEIETIYKSGADLPFNQREIDHRHFVINLNIEPGESKTFYALAVGSGDLHPPITMWDKQAYIEKTQKEFTLLGIFYGVIFVMILYNLFLYFSLRLKSYLYYVIAITCTLLGKLSINGLAFQYLWPNYPSWNLVAAPVWVALACIFIIIFSRTFLDIDHYIPSFKNLFYGLIFLNSLVIIILPFSRYIALYMMVIASISTFTIILTIAIICLQKGARQARFYILGWLIFLTGVSITILERAVILPFTLVTEYAGQAALTIEVVLLSLALADKINIMRQEKLLAEQKAQESQALAMQNLKKSDELKDEFLAITSHELRTPLYGMIGIAESLRDGIAGNVSPEVKNQLSMIITSGQRLTHLVNEILDFSKLKYNSLDLSVKPVNIKSVIDLVLTVSKPLINNKPIRLINKVDNVLPAIRADEDRLQQIMHNLIDNAIKYTDVGEIVITAHTDETHLTINVSDTGHGISADQLDVIFQPFKQGNHSLSRKVSGVGIGLSVTKNLIELHEGTLEVESKVGKGSTFSVSFPLHEDVGYYEETAVTSEATFTESLELQNFSQREVENKAKILVTDDEIVNLQVLMNQLSLNGYDVLTTSRGEDVFKIVDEHNIDLLILDIMMPNMSGYEVCQKLREIYSVMELPILMLTAKNQLQDKMIAFEAGANDYLVKPCDKEELLSRVKTLVLMKKLNQEVVQMNLHLEEKVSERTYEIKVANDNLLAMADSRRQLLANIAHELGTPVTLIHNYVQSIQKGLIDLDDLRYRKLVQDKISVLNRLIDDLFDLSKFESGNMSLNVQKTDVGEWLEHLYNKYEIIVSQEERTFKYSEVTALFTNYVAFFDIERIDQLFSNLISNAIKNTQAKTGKIEINALLTDDEYMTIEIHDNGLGIKKEDLPFIFERFYKKNSSAKEQYGTGLGLAIVKQIVQSHKGKIRVESEIDVGTVFYISLPVHYEEG